MKKRAKQYTKEFVARAVELADQSVRPIAEVARDLSVEYATLYAWMTKAGKTKKRVDVAAAAPQTEAAMKAELERLRLELEEVKKERDFLKKAAAFFAQQNK
jgi:transposase